MRSAAADICEPYSTPTAAILDPSGISSPVPSRNRFVVPAIAGPHRLVPIVSLATTTQSVLTLRAAIERGGSKAQKGPDGQWRSTRAWVDEYVASKYRRGS